MHLPKNRRKIIKKLWFYFSFFFSEEQSGDINETFVLPLYLFFFSFFVLRHWMAFRFSFIGLYSGLSPLSHFFSLSFCISTYFILYERKISDFLLVYILVFGTSIRSLPSLSSILLFHSSTKFDFFLVRPTCFLLPTFFPFHDFSLLKSFSPIRAKKTSISLLLSFVTMQKNRLFVSNQNLYCWMRL